jgi:hypothetical protein
VLAQRRVRYLRRFPGPPLLPHLQSIEQSPTISLEQHEIAVRASNSSQALVLAYIA